MEWFAERVRAMGRSKFFKKGSGPRQGLNVDPLSEREGIINIIAHSAKTQKMIRPASYSAALFRVDYLFSV
jgi:hypothetical protein